MKKLLLLVALMGFTAMANAFTIDDVKCWAGSGSNRSVLILQWPDSVSKALAFGYKWDGTATGAEMIEAITTANPRLKYEGSSSAYGMYITGFKYDTNNNGSFDDDEDLSASGWSVSGYWAYYLGTSLDATWTYAPVGCSSRKLTDGSVDAWAFASSGVTWKEIEAAPAVTPTGISSEVAEKAVQSVAYYNLQGVQSAVPFSGINVVVTTYTDGSRSTVKVVK